MTSIRGMGRTMVAVDNPTKVKLDVLATGSTIGETIRALVDKAYHDSQGKLPGVGPVEEPTIRTLKKGLDENLTITHALAETIVGILGAFALGKGIIWDKASGDQAVAGAERELIELGRALANKIKDEQAQMDIKEENVEAT